MDSIEQRVKSIIAEQLAIKDEAEVKNESSFLDDLGADSLDMVELVMCLEDEFETEIPDKKQKKSLLFNKLLILSLLTRSNRLGDFCKPPKPSLVASNC